MLKYVSVYCYANGDISFQCSLQYLVNVYQKIVSIYNIYIQYREKICELSGLFFDGGEKKSFASKNCVVSIAPIP